MNEGVVSINYVRLGLIRTKSLKWLNSKFQAKRIEYILEWNLLEKSVKRPFCCTVSILQVYFTFWGPGT